MKRLPRHLPVRQQGSVLAVVLVFLVFVAIFSVMAMQSATLESRMVATATFQEEALANAELGLKLGEQAIIAEIDDGDALNINDSDIFYPVEGSGTINPIARDWSAIPQTGRDTARGIEYVIQYAGTGTKAGSGAGASVAIKPPGISPSGTAHLFIITSKAEVSGAMRMVQSVYISDTAP